MRVFRRKDNHSGKKHTLVHACFATSNAFNQEKQWKLTILTSSFIHGLSGQRESLSQVLQTPKRVFLTSKFCIDYAIKKLKFVFLCSRARQGMGGGGGRVREKKRDRVKGGFSEFCSLAHNIKRQYV